MKKFYSFEVTQEKVILNGIEKDEEKDTDPIIVPVYEENERDAISQAIVSLLNMMYMEMEEEDSISEVIVEGNNLIFKGTDQGRDLVCINTFKVSESNFIHFK